jgi:hypothetical protein
MRLEVFRHPNYRYFKGIKRLSERIVRHFDPWGWLVTYPYVDERGRKAVRELSAEILELTGGKVFTGPFGGMQLPVSSPLSHRPFFILGSYEAEIHKFINQAVCMAPRRIINIGSAHGYYSVGLARLARSAQVIAFEADVEPHWAAALDLAKLNQVEDRIEQRGLCGVVDLLPLSGPRTLVVCDCEGGESELLDPEAVPGLRESFIICEVHECFAAGVTSKMIERFAPTHRIMLVDETEYNWESCRLLRRYPRRVRSILAREPRPVGRILTASRFMILQPRDESSWS